MSLRARLLASLAVMLVVALVAAGFLLVELTRASLVDRVDRDLLALSGPGNQLQRFGNLAASDNDAGRRLAILRLDRDGQGRAVVPVGLRERSRSPARPPRLHGRDPVPTPTARSWSGRRSTGRCSYRVILQRSRPSSTTLAIAAPLAGVDAAVAALVRTLLLTGVDRPHRSPRRSPGSSSATTCCPLERISRAAADIAAGDLTHRTGVPHDKTEVGRLGTAFDAMLDRIETSFGEQQAALDAKAASEERLRRFVADASHELRTPLTAVRGYADLYRAGGLSDPDELATAMARIGTESRRMGALVDDLLLLARLDQGRPIRQDPVDLSRIATDAVADARALEPGRPDRRRHRPGRGRRRRRGSPAPGRREPARQRPGPHAGRDAGRGRGAGPTTARPSCGSSTTARASTPRTARASSTASTVPIPRDRATMGAPGSGCRSRRPSPRPTAGGSGTRPRRAAGRPSSCGFHSQQVHSRRTVRLQRT